VRKVRARRQHPLVPANYEKLWPAEQNKWKWKLELFWLKACALAALLRGGRSHKSHKSRNLILDSSKISCTDFWPKLLIAKYLYTNINNDKSILTLHDDATGRRFSTLLDATGHDATLTLPCCRATRTLPGCYSDSNLDATRRRY
jgi:hypothetical protein